MVDVPVIINVMKRDILGAAKTFRVTFRGLIIRHVVPASVNDCGQTSISEIAIPSYLLRSSDQ